MCGQHVSSDGWKGSDTEVLQVCLQIPHTVSVIYDQLSLGTTLGLQETDVFGVLAVDSIKTIHLNRKGQLWAHFLKYLLNKCRVPLFTVSVNGTFKLKPIWLEVFLLVCFFKAVFAVIRDQMKERSKRGERPYTTNHKSCHAGLCCGRGFTDSCITRLSAWCLQRLFFFFFYQLYTFCSPNKVFLLVYTSWSQQL